MTDAPLLTLLHLSDSLFPLGGFSHSDGLETVAASGRISSADDLRSWMETLLAESLGRCDGPAVKLAGRCAAGLPRTVGELRALDAELHALRPSSTLRQASRAMGTRLIKTWRQIDPWHRAGELPEVLTLPVAFGAICALAGVAERPALDAFLYTRLAATISCAMRLISIGQQEAHALLAEMLRQVPPVVDGILSRDDLPSAFVPAMDLAAMGQQYLHSRLFRS